MLFSSVDELGGYGRRFASYQNLRPASWVEQDPGFDHNVFIIGAGHNGSALAFALSRRGIGGVDIIDAASESGAGIWRNIARMHKLRTPKTNIGPDLGYVPFSFPSWFEAKNGAGAFEAVDRVTRVDWADYLVWFNKEADIKIRYETRLISLQQHGNGFKLTLESKGKRSTETARKVVLANGLTGTGVPNIPESIVENIPAELYCHTSDGLNEEKFRGKVVAVVGAAASAFDAAAVALEAGAARVHMVCRRDALTARVMNKHRSYPGAVDHFYLLPDNLRWHLFNVSSKGGVAPPVDSILRVTKHENFHLHLGANFSSARLHGGCIRWVVGDEDLDLDYIVAATGYLPNPKLRPELSHISDAIALWGDRYSAPADEDNPLLETYPYLAGGFQFTEKNPGEAPWLANLHCYTNSAALSFGRSVGDLPTMHWGINHLANTIADDMFFQDIGKHERRMSVVPTEKEYSEEIYRNRIYTKQGELA